MLQEQRQAGSSSRLAGRKQLGLAVTRLAPSLRCPRRSPAPEAETPFGARPGWPESGLVRGAQHHSGLRGKLCLGL